VRIRSRGEQVHQLFGNRIRMDQGLQCRFFPGFLAF
jgi:hypothetical protein